MVDRALGATRCIGRLGVRCAAHRCSGAQSPSPESESASPGRGLVRPTGRLRASRDGVTSATRLATSGPSRWTLCVPVVHSRTCRSRSSFAQASKQVGPLAAQPCLSSSGVRVRLARVHRAGRRDPSLWRTTRPRSRGSASSGRRHRVEDDHGGLARAEESDHQTSLRQAGAFGTHWRIAGTHGRQAATRQSALPSPPTQVTSRLALIPFCVRM